MSNELKLIRVDVKNFGRIDESRPILVYLGDKDNENIILAEGDQQEGKSSWLEAIKGLAGSSLRLKEENYVNKTTKKIEADMEFEYAGRKFRCTWRKSYFKVQEFKTDEVLDRSEWVDLRSPSELLKKIIGYVAETPINLQTLDGAKQVEKFKEVLGADKGLAEKESKLKKSIEELSNGRRDANSLYVGLKKKLEANPMYIDWEQTEAKFKGGEKDIKEEKAKVDAAAAKVQQYNNAVTKLEQIKKDIETNENDITVIEKQIEELQIKLQLSKSGLEDKKKSLEVGNKFIEDNKGAQAEYDSVFNEYSEISDFNAQHSLWLNVIKDKKDMDEAQELVAQADSRKSELKADMRDLYSDYLPNIEGLEVVSVEGLDSDKPVGVYYNGLSISLLSESELWGLYMKIWDALNVKFVIIDNVSSLGSGAIGMVNTLAKHGCYVFAAQMKRGDELSLTIKSEL
jgi:hypothetical protein